MGKTGSFIKRFTDIILSVFFLIISSPILLLSIIAIKLDSKGPAFFVQQRTGLHGKNFAMIKLRGMVVNASEIGPLLTQKNDPRLTRVGKILRNLSIDEIPQFINVLKGEMSIVGPRPEIIEITEGYTEGQKRIFNYKPGITGYSQINGRQTLTSEQRLEMELEYYPRANFFSDLLIFLKTPIVVFTNEGNF